MTRRGERARDESGMTLIEILVTMTIMLVVFAIFAGGLGLAIYGSDVNNRQASASGAIKSAAESVKVAAYTPCAIATDFSLPNPPTGFTWDAPVVSYWDGSAAYVPACPVTGDKGAQLIELRLSSTRTLPNADSGQQQVIESELQVVKRDPTP